MSDFELRLSEVALKVSTYAGYSDNDRCLIQKLLADVRQLRTDFDAVKQNFSNHVAEMKKSSEIVADLKKLVCTIREEFARNLNTTHTNIAQTVENKSKVIPDLVSALQDLNARMIKYDHDLEAVALDSRNSMLKTNNIEVVTMLNRKKLENIQLMLKQPQKS
jgi:hypothetical protein